MTSEEFLQRYRELGHAIQTGIKMKLEEDLRLASIPSSLIDALKHIRVGVDTVKSDNGALTRLLVKKGVFTDEEYFEAILEGLEDKVKSYEKLLEDRYGLKGVKLR